MSVLMQRILRLKNYIVNNILKNIWTVGREFSKENRRLQIVSITCMQVYIHNRDANGPKLFSPSLESFGTAFVRLAHRKVVLKIILFFNKSKIWKNASKIK